ncbi:phenylacetic acid degradation protein [Rhodovulum viride]|uniref:Phenylacetic acid degradation protein n=1 Tax=Rhodovulum viride TaxID=1231134 RepID=A0ABX9DJF5_9RHOB|nr:PaaI family thioesterase [Rhodovulum viride]RAP42504.1 phenylacetic acid degradation protein [Rhodovulum viride]
MQHAPRNPDFEAIVRESFARQAMMSTLGAGLVSVAPGAVAISAPIRPQFGQQIGAAHAAFTFALADSAAGYTALSLMPPDHDVLTSEASIHLLAPALGDRLIATGSVVKTGKRLFVVRSEVFAETGNRPGQGRTHVASFTGTMVPIPL